MLLVIFLVLIVGGLATSFSVSARLQVQIARDLSHGLQAELSALSGLEFGQRQLALDPLWNGTGVDGMLIDGDWILVERQEQSGGGYGVEVTTLRVQADADSSRCVLLAEVEVATSDLVQNKALAVLGPEVEMRHCTVEGDIAMSDTPGGVYDWVPDGLGGGDWLPTADVPLGDFAFSSTSVTGTLYKHGIVPYLPGSDERTTTLPLMMPSWDLDPYLAADPRVVVYDRISRLESVVVEETALFVLDPGQELTLDDVELRGGAIIYVANDYDLRGPARNRVVLKHVNKIGGGDQGVHPNIGLVAPAAVISDETGLVNTFTGVSFWHTMDNVNRVAFHGQLLVVNGAVLNNADLVFDPDATQNPPLGITYAGPQPGARILNLREEFEE